MSKEVDDYLSKVPEPARTTLQKIRTAIKAAVPEATEALSYRMPTFKYRGKALLGLSAAKEHCSVHFMGYIPPELEADLEKYDTAKGTVRFPVDKPLPTSLIRKFVKVRVAQVEGASGPSRSR